MNSVRQILEIDKILSKISWFIKTKKGQNILEKLDVFPNEELCKTELKKTYDLGIIINKLGDLPICSHIDVLEEINKAKKGTVLDEETFNLIKEELLSIKDVIKYIHKIEEKPESLLEEFNGLVFDDQLHDKIVRVITSENKVALSMAIVEYLIERKCISLITSHYPLLKEYGLHNKNVLSASFIFNEERIEPTFRIVYDISGKSFGFLIAEKFGLKRNLIDRAKDIYNENYVDDNDRKIEIIENKERALFNKNIEIDNKMRELQRFEAEIKKRDDALNLKEEKLKNKKIDDFDDFVNSKIDEIDEIVEEFKKSNKENAKAIIEKINSINIEKKEKEPIFVGDYVEIKSLNMEGKVVSINNNRVEIVTKAGMTLKASKDACVKLSGPSKVKPKIANIDKMVYGKESLSTSINLIGYHVDEALRSLDKYLSDCYSRGYKSVRVIHGYGTGKLRQGIHNHLKTISYVKDFNLGTSVDGGTGLTVVNFK